MYTTYLTLYTYIQILHYTHIHRIKYMIHIIQYNVLVI